MSDSQGIRLINIRDGYAELGSASKRVHDSLLQGSENDSYLFDPRCSQLVDPIHEHRLVRDRKHVFVPGVCQRTEPRSMPTRQEQTLQPSLKPPFSEGTNAKARNKCVKARLPVTKNQVSSLQSRD